MQWPNDFLKGLIEEAKVDEVGLWFIISRIRDEMEVSDRDRLRKVTMLCVKNLLASGEVRAGYYRPDGSGFEKWNLEPHDIVGLIDRQWDELGREPDIGEVVVFVGNG